MMEQKHTWHTLWCTFSCAAMMLAFTTQGGAQWESRAPLSASATVRLIAVKPSSISVSVHEVPLAFDFQPNITNAPLALPVTTTWNVNPLEVRGVEVVAYFADPEHALTSPEAAFIPARNVFARVDGSPYRPFDQTNRFGPAGSSLRLLSESISSANRLATRNQLVEIRLDETRLQDQPPGHYSGVLQIEARYY
jgi:hypothetical protein